MPDFTLISRSFVDHTGFDIEMDRETCRAANPQLSARATLPTARLFDIHFALGQLCIYPLVTIPNARFLKPRYPKIRSICVDIDASDSLPTEAFGARDFLQENLPSGFVKDPVFGLGLMKEMRPIINAIENVPAVSHLAILHGEPTRIDGETYYLNHDDYEDIRLAFQRIARRYQGDSLADRTILAHNELLQKILPSQFAPKDRPYQPGTVFKLLGGRAAGEIALRGRDRRSVVVAVSHNARTIADSDPKEFVQLQKDIELVALDRLIDDFIKLLNRNRGEKDWQRLFELNPFILSMVFGYPIVVVGPGASVGGMTFQGTGAKIADFLAKNSTTQNAALIEIKHPQTALFGEEYRKNVWSPSKDVTGAIVQVLDQRQKFATNIAQLKYNSGIAELQAYAVDCVLILGRTPSDPHKIGSLELIRTQLKDVRIVTFDELLQKLVLLREMLSGERYTPPSPLSDQNGASLGGNANEDEVDETE